MSHLLRVSHLQYRRPAVLVAGNCGWSGAPAASGASNCGQPFGLAGASINQIELNGNSLYWSLPVVGETGCNHPLGLLL